MESDALEALQSWYLSRCDGEWEHSNGIRIGTLDNPGWSLEIDLEGTALAGREFVPVSVEKSGIEWMSCEVGERKFVAFGGPLMLGRMVGVFLEWAA